MKKQLIWGYPGLCLCFAFISLICSCAVKNKVYSPDIVNHETTEWKIEFWLRADNSNWTLPDHDEVFLSPYDVKKITDSGSGSDVLVLSYHVQSLSQLAKLKEMLLATGSVINIKTTNFAKE